MAQDFSYQLRPRKNVERKMLCEAFTRLNAVAALTSYRYVGMGAVEFRDFLLVHQRLGIDQMVNIEMEDDERERFKFNRPYSCIRLEWGKTTEVLHKLKWTSRSIVWLDYTCKLNVECLRDISYLVGQLRSGSALVVTVNAHPFGDPKAAPLDLLEAEVGAKRVPSGTKAGDLTDWGVAKTYRSIVQREIEDALSARNGVLPKDRRLAYRQLFNFRYKDGARMLTVGGVLLDPKDALRVGSHGFDGLDFVRAGDEAFEIRVPLLTRREMALLDSRLPRGRRVSLAWLGGTAIADYRAIYRYSPMFGEFGG